MEKVTEYIYKLVNNGYTNYMCAIVILLMVFVVAPWIVRGLLSVSGYRGKAKASKLYTPLKFMFYIGGIYVALVYCNLPDDTFAIARKIVRISLIGLVTITLVNFINTKPVKDFEKRFNTDKTSRLVINKVLKAVFLIIALFLIISELGYNANGLIASLGISGVVIAFAAQDLGKNLVGGATVIADKSVSIGDWIEVGGVAGSVVDMNMRNVRLQKFDGSLATIPNSTLVSSSITNWSKIKTRRYTFNVLLTLDSKMKTVENFIEESYGVLGNLPTVVEDSVHISFDAILDSGYNVLFYLDSTTVPYGEFIKFKELVNYTIIQLLEKNKLEMAYPTQTIQMMK